MRLHGTGNLREEGDEAGNITTLSPHNFSLIGQPSEPVAWSFYSENEHGKINVAMVHAMLYLLLVLSCVYGTNIVFGKKNKI